MRNLGGDRPTWSTPAPTTTGTSEQRGRGCTAWTGRRRGEGACRDNLLRVQMASHLQSPPPLGWPGLVPGQAALELAEHVGAKCCLPGWGECSFVGGVRMHNQPGMGKPAVPGCCGPASHPLVQAFLFWKILGFQNPAPSSIHPFIHSLNTKCSLNAGPGGTMTTKQVSAEYLFFFLSAQQGQWGAPGWSEGSLSPLRLLGLIWAPWSMLDLDCACSSLSSVSLWPQDPGPFLGIGDTVVNKTNTY